MSFSMFDFSHSLIQKTVFVTSWNFQLRVIQQNEKFRLVKYLEYAKLIRFSKESSQK